MQSKIDTYNHFHEGGGVYGLQMRILKALQSAELCFCRHIMGSKADVTTSIPVDKIVDDILMQPVVLSLWENITLGLDFSISSECSKLALENFVKLFVRVRSFSYARHCELT